MYRSTLSHDADQLKARGSSISCCDARRVFFWVVLTIAFLGVPPGCSGDTWVEVAEHTFQDPDHTFSDHELVQLDGEQETHQMEVEFAENDPPRAVGITLDVEQVRRFKVAREQRLADARWFSINDFYHHEDDETDDASLTEDDEETDPASLERQLYLDGFRLPVGVDDGPLDGTWLLVIERTREDRVLREWNLHFEWKGE